MPKKRIADGRYIVSLDEMSQEIDLESYLGKKPTKKQAKMFAELAINTIETRTLDGQTINGGKFKKYSKKYADFKGVTQDSVDLFLEGDMLNSLSYEIVDNKPKISIDGDLQTKKGYNHNVGDTLPKRPWFGLTDSEAKEIADSLKQETAQDKKPLTLASLRDVLNLLDIEQTE